MEIIYQTFSEFLDKLDSYRGLDVVYIPQADLTLESLCLVHSPDDVEDDSFDEPKPARDRNLVPGLEILDIRGIRRNLEQQGLKDVDKNSYLKAIKFYLENDAYALIEDL